MVNSRGLSIKKRIVLTAIVSLLVWLHLIWDYLHGGVPTHYLLQSEDLPGISNWWGGITLPLVTFLLLFWIHKNLSNVSEHAKANSHQAIIVRFISALGFGILLSVFFTIGSSAPGYMMLGAILLSFFVPLYRPEFLLGFILGMSYTFGANLSIIVSFVLVLVFLMAFKLIRFGVLKIFSREG